MKNSVKFFDIRVMMYVIPPALSIFLFIFINYINPLILSEELNLMASFFLAFLILLIGLYSNIIWEFKEAKLISKRTCGALKRSFHVVPIGGPIEAIKYINRKMPELKRIRNTSFNLEEEISNSEEELYKTEVYDKFIRNIAKFSSSNPNFSCKDIGDEYAIERFQKIKNMSYSLNKNSKYDFRITTSKDPQMSYTILDYSNNDKTENKNKEVLFNWDFNRMDSDEPVVLVSNDEEIVKFFLVHFNYLWKSASRDHDSTATKSISKK